MSFWYVILVIISANGEARAVAHYPKSPDFNNERNCLAYGKELSETVQMELGTKNARVFWKCESVSYETISKSLPRT